MNKNMGIYEYQCMNCDDEFNMESDALAHVEFHKKAFEDNKIEVIKEYGRIPPTGMWKKILF